MILTDGITSATRPSFNSAMGHLDKLTCDKADDELQSLGHEEAYILSRAFDYACGRAIGTTDDEQLCLLPKATKPGDPTVGSWFHAVMKPCDDGFCKFVGMRYCDCFSNCEALSGSEGSIVEISLLYIQPPALTTWVMHALSVETFFQMT